MNVSNVSCFIKDIDNNRISKRKRKEKEKNAKEKRNARNMFLVW